MTTRAETSPSLIARTIGILLLVMAVGGFAGFGTRSALIAPDDAAATAANILAAPQFFQIGFLGDLVAFVCDVPVAVLLYVLLRAVSRPLALLALSFRLVYTAVAGANLLNHLGATLLLGGDSYLSTFDTTQRQALALLFLNMREQGFSLALVFFGFHLLVLGILLFVSGYLPRLLGLLMALAGLAYLTDSLSLLFFPALNATVAPFLVAPESAELVLAVWLLVKGVRAQPVAG